MNHLDNFQPVRDVLAYLRDGLGRFVLDEYKRRYSAKDYLDELQVALREEYPFEDKEQARRDVDLQGWLKAMQGRWEDVFSKKLGHAAPKAKSNSNIANARNFLYEIQNARNSFIAHETAGTAITDDDVYSLADTATRLLGVVKATEEAGKTEEVKLAFGRRLFSAEASQTEPISGEADPDESEDRSGEPESTDPAAQVGDEEAPRRVDLSGLNLSGMDLRGRNLHLANLKNADLSDSNLMYVQLTDMDLSNAKLSKSNLTDADLSGTNLSLANLSESILAYANLINSNLSHARLEKADLSVAKINRADFSHADLTGANLSDFLPEEYGETLLNDEAFDYMLKARGYTYVNLSHATLRDAKMQRMLLEPADLTGADLTRVDFTGSRIASASLADSILNSANLSKCYILTCDFSGAKMQHVDLSESECVYSNFSNAKLSGANLEGFTVADVETVEEESWINVDLSQANLRRAFLARISFRNSNLKGANFQDANLSRADLSNADLNETDFTDADLTCADFTGAKFYPLSTILPDGTYWTEDTDLTEFTGPLDNS
ncbi:MAG: pentapeptide repeat-containing protein [Chloroflexota bacterium]|nr:pentapeptide repeat-containing protein [Chloroflexota bacterium]